MIKFARIMQMGGIVNPTMFAFENAWKAFEGEAERLGLKDIDDVVALVRDVRG